MGRIPKRVEPLGRTDTLTMGAKKALGNMISEYGSSDGKRIFIQKAKEQGKGTTLRQMVNSTYKKGRS
jgi:hypothetical protein